MLVIGSGLKTDDYDCFFPLPQYLVVGGAVSLSMVVLAVVAKRVMEWVLSDAKMTRAGWHITKGLDWLGMFMAWVQVAVLIALSAILFPNIMELSYDPESDNYCNYGAVVFTSFLLGMCWFFIIVLIVAYLYIFWNRSTKIETRKDSSFENFLEEIRHTIGKKKKSPRKVGMDAVHNDRPR